MCWNRNRPGINFSHSSSWGRMKSSDWWNKNNFTWAFQIPLQSFYWRTHLGKDHHSDHMPSALCFSLSHFSPSSSSIQAPVIKICIFMYIALSRPKSVSWRSSALLSGFRRQKWTPRQRCSFTGILFTGMAKEELKSPAVLSLYPCLVTAASLPCS